MNPSPDRNKESLPPKKRDSRQGSTDQPVQEDDFKPPAPFRSRRQHHISESSRVAVDRLPPPLPALPLPPPWQLPYTPSMPTSYLPVHPSERQVSPLWKGMLCGRGADGGLEQTVPHYPHWLNRDMQPLISVSNFKSVYTADSREMWPPGQSRREFCSQLFPSHDFPQPALYPQETIPHRRLRYQDRCPNSVEDQETQYRFSTRVASSDNHGNDFGARLDRSHAKCRKTLENVRKSQERCLLPQVSTHSSSWERDFQKSKLHSSNSKVVNTISSQDNSGGNAAQDNLGGNAAQIYYAVGSLCPQQSPPAPPYLSPSVSSSQRNSQEQHNSHGAETNWDSSNPDAATSTSPFAVLPHFVKGSLIEIAGGQLKRVEELKTADFLRSADTQPEFHLSTCTVLLISPGPSDGFNSLQVFLADRNTQELLTVLAEYPFFVRGRGWSSCSPQRSMWLYGLQCRQLSTGDECLVLTPVTTAIGSRSQEQRSETAERKAGAVVLQKDIKPRKRRWSAPELKSRASPGATLPQALQ